MTCDSDGDSVAGLESAEVQDGAMKPEQWKVVLSIKTIFGDNVFEVDKGCLFETVFHRLTVLVQRRVSTGALFSSNTRRQ